MSDPQHADHITRREFSVGFRGFDQHEVRAFLGQIGAEVAAANEREAVLRARIAELEAVPQVELDEAALEAALGREATKVIHAAREAAAEIKARAEAEAAALVAEADALLAERSTEAETLASSIRAEVEEALSALREDTQRRATAIIEESRAQAAATLGEATAERDRVLEHLATKRREIIAELEQLHGARERLVAAHAEMRAALDSAMGQIDAATDASAAPVAVVDEPAPAPVPAPVAVVPESEPEPEPEVAFEVAVVEARVVEAPVVSEERRSPTVRLLRKTPEPSSAAPPPSDPIEGVRIIRPEPEPEAEPEPEPQVEAVAEPEPEPEPVASEPQPEPEPEVEVDVEVDVTASTDLFARLRADRAERVASAVAVLASDEVVAEAVADEEPTAAEEEPVEEPAALSPDLALLAARDEAVVDAERSAVRSLKRALADEQNEVLDALRRLRGAPTIAALLPDPAVHDARFDAVLGTSAAAAAAAAGAIVNGNGGNAGKVAADQGRAVAADIRLRIGRAVEESSGDVETLAEAISSTYREWKVSRVEPLARDVITAAFASGLYAAAVGELRWVVDPAEGGCPDCDDNALAGPTAKGSPFPTGQLHPPAHAGCRCVVVPVS